MTELRRLEISNIRGVRALTLDVKGNVALLGPNGAGKSSVADALDFLLTGSVRRLTGEGAGNLSLAEHGRNVLASSEDAWVRAMFRVQDGPSKRDVTLKRTLAEPGVLEVEGKATPALTSMVERARRCGHHLLSRREILKFILTSPSDRLAQVSALMQLDAIEELRLEFQGAAKKGREELKALKTQVETKERALLACVVPNARDGADLLAKVNAHRATLGAPAIATLEWKLLRDGAQAPEHAAAHPLQSGHAIDLITSLLARLEGRNDQAARARSFLAERAAWNTDRNAMAALKAHELVKRGLDLTVDDECPLCATPWNLDDLRTLLRSRLDAGADAETRVAALETTRRASIDEAQGLAGELEALGKALSRGSHGASTELVRLAADVRTNTNAVFVEVVAATVPAAADIEIAEGTLVEVVALVRALDNEAKRLPRLDGVRRAWDDLVSLERALQDLGATRNALPQTQRMADALAASEKAFAGARDKVLSGVYKAISNRLEELYRAIHGDGDGAEHQFSASIEPARAGLKLEVDFYGKGRFPPGALHSEGHQDTLGICLFVALAEHVAGGELPLVVLDDVLMSVDADHRRAVAELFRKHLASTQLVITTHDRVWARQLQSVGVTGRAVELQTVSLEFGARSGAQTFDPVDAARSRLREGNVPGAAHALRRGLEARFQDVCEAIQGKVKFRSQADYDLGELRDAVKERFSALLEDAIKSAKSWGKDLTALTALKEAWGIARTRVEKDEWIVNPTLHFNAWLDANKNDVGPILDAYEDFLRFFACTTCSGDLAIVENRAIGVKDLRCSCGATNLNLATKPKELSLAGPS